MARLLDRDAGNNTPREVNQRDLRHVRWERLPLEYREHAERAGLDEKQRRLLREWRKYWSRRIAEVKDERRKLERA